MADAPQKIPVLLDTDIGSDIDDAVALAYLLKQPRCELVGVTTVTGDVQKRAALAEAICLASGRSDVPIHCGSREVLVDGPGQPNVPQFEAIAAKMPRLDRPENSAVRFMIETIRDRPGEITLLTIGPYSNVALLFAIDPEIPHLLKDTVSMGGHFFRPGKEWNALVDPAATAMVYSASRRSHLSVGLDVTLKCKMAADDVRNRFVREPLITVASMAEKWFEHTGELTFHDPLAAALIFRPELCEYAHGQVEAPYVDVSEAGVTRLIEGTGPDRVATTVDSATFFQKFFQVMES